MFTHVISLLCIILYSLAWGAANGWAENKMAQPLQSLRSSIKAISKQLQTLTLNGVIHVDNKSLGTRFYRGNHCLWSGGPDYLWQPCLVRGTICGSHTRSGGTDYGRIIDGMTGQVFTVKHGGKTYAAKRIHSTLLA